MPLQASQSTLSNLQDFPMPQYSEVRILEVPKPVPTVEVVRHVPRVLVQEKEHRVSKPQLHVVERHVEQRHVQRVPQIVHVPKTEVRESIRYIQRPQVQTVEKIVHVPLVQTVERVVEVPEIHVQEIVREVPVQLTHAVNVPRGMLLDSPMTQQLMAPGSPLMTSSPQFNGGFSTPPTLTPPAPPFPGFNPTLMAVTPPCTPPMSTRF
jgi:hypothetical protein